MNTRLNSDIGANALMRVFSSYGGDLGSQQNPNNERVDTYEQEQISKQAHRKDMSN